MNRSIHIPRLRIEKICALVLSAVLLVSSLMTGSFAWYQLESVVNSFFGGSSSYSVVLEKYERDIQGNETGIPIEGALFDLYYLEETQPSPGVTQFVPVLMEEELVTDDEGLIRLGDLEAGEYYFVETAPTYNYTYDTDAAGAVIRRYPFTLNDKAADEGGAVRVTAYNQRLSGQLNITKTVRNEDGSDLTPEQQEMDFVFRISFSEEGKYTYSVTDSSELLELTDGTLTLKHGQTATFSDLPAGISYAVTEALVPGYETQSNDHQNEILPLSDQTAGITAEFINIWKDEQAVQTAPLIISKTVTGEAADPEQEFTFGIRIGDDDEQVYAYKVEGRAEETTATLRSGETISLRHGEQAVFEDLPLGTTWEVEEAAAQGYTPLVTKVDGLILDHENRADFVNHAEEVKETETGELLITKAVVAAEREETKAETTNPAEDAVFTFRVSFSDDGTYGYQKNGSGELLALTDGTLTLRHGEQALFTALPEGITWQVEELPADGYTAGISRQDGTVIRDVTASAAFVNFEQDPDEQRTTGSLAVSKRLSGEVTEADKSERFHFLIQFSDGNIYPYYIGDEETAYEMEAGGIWLCAGETAYFPDLPVGITYRVEEQLETTGMQERYIPLITSAEGMIPAGEQAAVTFVNHVPAETAIRTGELKLSKQLSGAVDDSDDSFTFTVTFSDGNSYPYWIGDTQYSLKDGDLTLKGGESAVFTDIPEGTGYVIRETDAGTEYLAGQTEQQGVIAAEQTAAAVFTNYQLERTELRIRKQIAADDEEPDLDREFWFTLTTEAFTEEFALRHGEEKVFHILKGAAYQLTEAEDAEYIQTSVTNGYGTGERDYIEIIKTNTKKPLVTDPPPADEGTNVQVQKLWKGDGEDVRPDTVQIQLYRDGEAFGGVQRISRETNWQHTWIGLSDQYAWTVAEQNVPDDYEMTIAGSQEAGYTITNTYLLDYPGDGDGDGQNPGDTGNGSGNGDGNGSNGGSDSTDHNGSSNTGGSNTGSSSTNGRDTSGNNASGNNTAAKTGDDINIWCWTLLLIGSALALRRMLFGKRRCEAV